MQNPCIQRANRVSKMFPSSGTVGKACEHSCMSQHLKANRQKQLQCVPASLPRPSFPCFLRATFQEEASTCAFHLRAPSVFPQAPTPSRFGAVVSQISPGTFSKPTDPSCLHSLDLGVAGDVSTPFSPNSCLLLALEMVFSPPLGGLHCPDIFFAMTIVCCLSFIYSLKAVVLWFFLDMKIAPISGFRLLPASWSLTHLHLQPGSSFGASVLSTRHHYPEASEVPYSHQVPN